MLAAVYWARAPRVVLPDRALCLPTFCHSLLTVNKSSSSSSSPDRALCLPTFSRLLIVNKPSPLFLIPG